MADTFSTKLKSKAFNASLKAAQKEMTTAYRSEAVRRRKPRQDTARAAKMGWDEPPYGLQSRGPFLAAANILEPDYDPLGDAPYKSNTIKVARQFARDARKAIMKTGPKEASAKHMLNKKGNTNSQKSSFRKGGSYKGKQHKYAAGGMVKELKI